MGRPIIQIILYFGIIDILLLGVYTAAVGNVNSNHDSPTIMDKIKSDTSLCPAAKNLTLSNFTKACTTIKYPDKEEEINLEQIDTLLCLGVYDAWHKYCLYSSLNVIHTYSNVTEFDVALKRYIPSYEKDKVNEKKQDFCKRLVGLNTTNSVLNTILVQLPKVLNNYALCSTICFNLEDDKFRKPLCAVMAWSNELTRNNTSNDTPNTQQKLPSDINKKTDHTSLIEKSNEEEKAKPSSKDHNKSSDDPVADKISGDKTVLLGDKTTQSAHAVKDLTKENEGQAVHPPENKQEKEKTSSAVSSPDAIKSSTQKKVQQSENNGQEQEQVENPQLMPAVVQPDIAKNHNEPVDPNANNPPEEKHTDDKKSNDNDAKSPGAPDNTHGHEETESEDYNNRAGSVPEHYDDDTISDTGMENNENNVNDLKKGMEKSSGNQNSPQVISHYSNVKPVEESHFYTYFTVMSVISILGYIGYHHKQKILAILLEGRRTRGNRGRRRPSTASYRKLDCTLEEAVNSQCNANVTHVIY